MKHETFDLLEGIQVLAKDQFIAALTKDPTVLPMYWRSCCRDGIHLKNIGDLCKQLDSVAACALGSVGQLEAAAWEFNWARIEALLGFQRQLITARALGGRIGGTGWTCPPMF